MDDILKNICVDSLSPDVVFGNGDDGGGYANKKNTGETVNGNDVWREIGIGAGITLEEYLSKFGVGGGNGRNEIVRVGDEADNLGLFGGIELANQFQQSCVGLPGQQGVVETSPGLVIGNGKARGKRKAVVEPVVDKATQQKQKRMIKNRESAARSRERKQVSLSINISLNH